MDMSTNMNRKAHTALKTLDLALSEARLGHEGAARTAAQRAGELAHAAGLTLTDVSTEVGPIAPEHDSLVWGTLVDAWYDCAERFALPAVAA